MQALRVTTRQANQPAVLQTTDIAGLKVRTRRETALLHLQHLLEMREDIRRAFGAYVRLWLRRRGLREAGQREVGRKPSLHTYLYGLGLVTEDASNLCWALGLKRRILIGFWADNLLRLPAVLDYLELKADEVLADMELALPGYPVLVRTPVDAAVLTLLDSFWQRAERTAHMVSHTEALQRFGIYLNTRYFTKRGDKSHLARRFAVHLGWSLVSGGDGVWKAKSYHTCFSNLVAGRRSGWSLATLELLAAGLETSMEELVHGYAQFLENEKKGA